MKLYFGENHLTDEYLYLLIVFCCSTCLNNKLWYANATLFYVTHIVQFCKPIIILLFFWNQ